MDNIENEDWRRETIEFLKIPRGTTDQKVKHKALSYAIIGNELFKKTPQEVLLKWISESEA